VRVAVVTPYYRETDEVLRACLDSVRDQTHAACRHIVVADGFPNPLVDDYEADHIRLPSAHGDNGNLGRCIGAFAAMSEGYDAVAFLDADNWLRPDHIERMVALQAMTGAAVCTSGRSVHRLDGTLLRERDTESDGAAFVDTSCLCVFRPAYDILSLWGTMPREAGPVCDRLIWEAINLRGIAYAHDPEPTVAFRSQYAFHYLNAGEEPPAGAKEGVGQKAMAEFGALPIGYRLGMLLGLGGASDLLALCAASTRPAIQTKTVTLNGNGRSVNVELPDDNGIRFVLKEIFSEQQYRPVPGLVPPRVVLDIGANVGIAAAFFRLVYPDAALICVEPDPNAYALLAQNAARLGNCQTFRLGLHHGTQVRPFHLGDGSTVLSSATAVTGSAARLLLIDANAFVALLRRNDFDLLKIDTEGSEISILLSLRQRLPSINVILLEFHSHTDRRLMDELLSESHYLWHANVISPHRGTLCYVKRTLTPTVPTDQPLT
jgi:FkbM family methyltransferase